MSNTAMEYSHGQMEMYIKDNTKKISIKVMDITGGQMAMSIMDSGRVVTCTERGSDKRKAFYTQLNMNKTIFTAN